MAGVILSVHTSSCKKAVVPIACLCPLLIALTAARVRAQAVSRDERNDPLVQKAKEAEAKGDSDEAIAKLQAALKLRPDSASLDTKLAALYFNRKQFVTAISYCDRALVADPRDGTAAKLAGMAAYQLNRFEPAAKYLQKGLALHSNDAELHYWMGMTFYSLNDARHALDEFYKVRLNNPKDVEALYMIGKVHWEMCQQAWEEMVKVDPNSVRVKQMVAEKDVQWNLYPDAVEKYLEIIKQQPDAPGFHYALGKLYLHIAKVQEAEDAFRGELKVDPHSYLSYYGLGDAAFQRQDLPAALENATRAIEEKPDFGDAYVLLGRTEWHMGNKEKATEVLDHAASLSPSDPSLFYMLGHLYGDLGKQELAAKALSTYQRLKDEQERENRAAR